MPSHPCKHPTCTAYLAAPGYCAQHASAGRDDQARRAQLYDATRNPAAKAFYNSAAWIRTRRQILAEHPVCQRCAQAWARHVHHIVPVLESEAARLDPSNLRALCQACHNAVEALAAKGVPCTFA